MNEKREHLNMKNKIPNVLMCYDAEWVPCARSGRRLYEIPNSEKDDVVFGRMWQEANATLDDPQPFLKLAISEVVSICAVERRCSGNGPEFELMSWPKRASMCSSEASLMESFLEHVATESAQLVGYNSNGSDLPILIQRAIANGCTCPNFGRRPEKPWEGNDYLSRYGDSNLDLMQAFSLSAGRGAASPSMHEMANACGIPGKLGTSGDNVAGLWLNGKHDEIIAYNETDACTTYLLWLRYVRFRGLLDDYDARRERDAFRRYLEQLAPSKPHLVRFLEVWDSLREPGAKRASLAA